MIRPKLLRPLFDRLEGDQRGATIVEFAIILLPLTVTLCGFLEIGYRVYVTSLLQGALHAAARQATIGDKSETAIDQMVKRQLAPLVRPDDISSVRKSYTQFSGVGKAERLVLDRNGNGSYDAGDCWIDSNPGGRFDKDGGAAGLGRADDIFYYEITVKYDRLLPLDKLLGWPAQEVVVGNTMMRNQPYAGRIAPPRVCG